MLKILKKIFIDYKLSKKITSSSFKVLKCADSFWDRKCYLCINCLTFTEVLKVSVRGI